MLQVSGMNGTLKKHLIYLGVTQSELSKTRLTKKSLKKPYSV